MTVANTMSNKDLKMLSILYVEDDEEIREQLIHFLKRRVGTLYTASNGKEGLASFRAHQPDIVVSDIRMPVMDGLDMVGAIKHEYPSTPVIMTTAFNETDYFLKAIDIGVDKYVMKPVKIETLVDAIHRSAHILQAERNLHLAATVFETAAEAIVIATPTRHIVSINPACAAILGYPAEAMAGFELTLLGDEAQQAEAGVPWETVFSQPHWHGEALLKRRNGETFPAWLSASTARTGDGEIAHHVLVFMDISEQKRREAEILALNEELRAARDDLERKVEERTWDLVVARDAAETANRAKSQFLSQMSHELRTPMNAILGFTELLQSDEDAPLTVEQKESTDEILRAGYHLLDLINDVLDLAKVESGKFTLNMEPVPVLETFKECLDLIRPLAERRHIQINAKITEEFVVKADRTRLKQVIINLLSNAVKYNRDAGRIDIECKVSGSRLHIGVSDTGVGIRDEDKPKLFQPFERFGPTTAFQEGTGIGLALTLRLVELMGGQITLDSVPGEGSTFWVELALVSDEKGGGLKTTGLTGHGEKSMDCLRGRSILYVEDNPANQHFMEALFAKFPDTRLITASRAGEGLGLALTELPDFIILDIALPDMTGYELMSYLRDEPTLNNTPIVALSANAMPEDQARGLEAGFDEYLTKPVQIDRLLGTLEHLLRQGPKASKPEGNLG